MTTHELAKALKKCPNVPVIINGWRNDAGKAYEVTQVSPVGTCLFHATDDNTLPPGFRVTYDRKCVFLDHKP